MELLNRNRKKAPHGKFMMNVDISMASLNSAVTHGDLLPTLAHPLRFEGRDFSLTIITAMYVWKTQTHSLIDLDHRHHLHLPWLAILHTMGILHILKYPSRDLRRLLSYHHPRFLLQSVHQSRHLSLLQPH
jgi:hypothetical protein